MTLTIKQKWSRNEALIRGRPAVERIPTQQRQVRQKRQNDGRRRSLAAANLRICRWLKTTAELTEKVNAVI